MRFEGKVFRDGRFWLAEIPLLEAMTQGRTRKEALQMIGDWLETMVNRVGFHADVHTRSASAFEVSGSDAGAMIQPVVEKAPAAPHDFFSPVTIRRPIMSCVP